MYVFMYVCMHACMQTPASYNFYIATRVYVCYIHARELTGLRYMGVQKRTTLFRKSYCSGMRHSLDHIAELHDCAITFGSRLVLACTGLHRLCLWQSPLHVDLSEKRQEALNRPNLSHLAGLGTRLNHASRNIMQHHAASCNSLTHSCTSKQRSRERPSRTGPHPHPAT